MKRRGFKQLFTQQQQHQRNTTTTYSRSNIEAATDIVDDEMTMNVGAGAGDGAESEQRKRPARFFQKFFRPITSGGSSSSHTPSSRGDDSPQLIMNSTSRVADEDEYTEIKREMSVPVSPKSVKFRDELPARRGRSAVPQTSSSSSKQFGSTSGNDYIAGSPPTKKVAPQPLVWRSQQLQSTSSSSRDALDEATRHLLELSEQSRAHNVVITTPTVTTTPSGDHYDHETVDAAAVASTARAGVGDGATTASTSISYSSTARLTPAADQLQKSASTSSMNKVIRTNDGGILKLANVFTWDAARLREHSPTPRPISPIEHTMQGAGGKPLTFLVYRDGTMRGPPAVQTNVQGKLQMEKIVGADLTNVEHCVSSGWIIKDTVTNYKVKTTMGDRTLVMEECRLPNGEEYSNANEYKMSVYEENKLKMQHRTDIEIPPNTDNRAEHDEDDDIEQQKGHELKREENKEEEEVAAKELVNDVIYNENLKQSKRIVHIRVSEEPERRTMAKTKCFTNEDSHGDISLTDDTRWPSSNNNDDLCVESMAEICYLIKVTRTEESGACTVEINVARSQHWRSAVISSSLVAKDTVQLQVITSSTLSSSTNNCKQSDEEKQSNDKTIETEQENITKQRITAIHIVPIEMNNENTSDYYTEKLSSSAIENKKLFQIDQHTIDSQNIHRTVPIRVSATTSADSDDNDRRYSSFESLRVSSSIRDEIDDLRSRILKDYDNVRKTFLDDRNENRLKHAASCENGLGSLSGASKTVMSAYEDDDMLRRGYYCHLNEQHRSRSTTNVDEQQRYGTNLRQRRHNGDYSIAEHIPRSPITRSSASDYRRSTPGFRQRSSLSSTSSSTTNEREIQIRRIFDDRQRSASSGADTVKTLTEDEKHELFNRGLRLREEKRELHENSSSGWSDELSAARIAMMQAGVDLETVLLSTPASMFAENAIRREMQLHNDARHSLMHAQRCISESGYLDDDYEEDDGAWRVDSRGYGYYRSFEYRHQWSSERDIRAVSIEQYQSPNCRFMRSSHSATRLERLVRARYDHLDVDDERSSAIRNHAIETRNLKDKSQLQQQCLVENINEKYNHERIRSETERRQAEEQQQQRRMIQIDREDMSDSINEQFKQNMDLTRHSLPSIVQTFSSKASQTETSLQPRRHFDYITTVDTVIRSDEQKQLQPQQQQEIGPKNAEKWQQIEKKSFIDERQETTTKQSSSFEMILTSAKVPPAEMTANTMSIIQTTQATQTDEQALDYAEGRFSMMDIASTTYSKNIYDRSAVFKQTDKQFIESSAMQSCMQQQQQQHLQQLSKDSTTEQLQESSKLQIDSEYHDTFEKMEHEQISDGTHAVQRATTNDEHVVDDEKRDVVDNQRSTVIQEADAEKYLASKNVEEERLETLMSSERTHTLDSEIIKKSHETDGIEMQQLSHERESVERGWTISFHGLDECVENKVTEQKSMVEEEFENQQKQQQYIKVEECFVEECNEECSTEGQFVRITKRQPIESVEVKVNLQRNLEIPLQLTCAKEESIVQSSTLEKQPGLEEAIIQMLNIEKDDTISSSMNAAAESLITETDDLSKKSDELIAQETMVSREKSEVTSKNLIETSVEEKNYIGGWDQIVREMSAEGKFDEILKISETLTTMSSKENVVLLSSQIQQQNQQQLSTGTVIRTRLLCEACAESEQFAINEQYHQMIFENAQQQIYAICVHVVEQVQFQQFAILLPQFGSTETEAIAYFSRLSAPIRNRLEKVEIVCELRRVWQETFTTKASKHEIITADDTHLIVDEQTQHSNVLSLKEIIEMNIQLSCEAAREETVAIEDAKFKNAQSITLEDTASVVHLTIQQMSRAQVLSKPLREFNEMAKFVNTSCTTVLTDEDVEVSVYETFRDHASFSTQTPKSSSVDVVQQLKMLPAEDLIGLSIPIATQFQRYQGNFAISEESHEELLKSKKSECMQTQVSAVTSMVDHVTGAFVEFGDTQANAVVLLMRKSTIKKTANASHTVSLSTTITQTLDALAAQQCFQSVSANFEVPSAKNEEDANKTLAISRTDNVQLNATHLTEETTAQNIDLLQTKAMQETAEDAECVLRSSNREHLIAEKLREYESDAFEILSEWTTIYRDLEAYRTLRDRINIKHVTTIVASSEENVQLNAEWNQEDDDGQVMDVICCLADVVFDKCKRTFEINQNSQEIRMEKRAQNEVTFTLEKDARREQVVVRVRESGTVKMNVIINLHKICEVSPAQRQKILTNECTWADRMNVSVEPIYVKCEATESDYIAVQQHINRCQRHLDQLSIECRRIAANSIEPIEFECEAATDERLKLFVDIHYKPIAHDEYEKIWPLANRNDSILMFETEEYGDEKCAVFVQLTSKQLTFADCDWYSAICRRYEAAPLLLITKAALDLTADLVEYQHQIPSEHSHISRIIHIANKNEQPVLIDLREPQQHLLTIGLQYAKDENKSAVKCCLVDVRFGGEYVLETKSTQVHECSATLQFLRRTQLEMTKIQQPQKFTATLQLFVNASTTETILAAFTCNKLPSEDSPAEACRRCARKDQINANFTESTQIMHTIHAYFKNNAQSSHTLSITYPLAHFGGHFALNTEYAEENHYSSEFRLVKNECFMNNNATFDAPNLCAYPMLLQTKYATEDTAMCTNDWSKSAQYQVVDVVCKQANKEVIVVNLLECSQINETTYLQYSKDEQHLKSAEQVVNKARFGGRLLLQTDAAEEHELNVCRQLESNRAFILHSSKLLVERPSKLKIQATLSASKSEVHEIEVDLMATMNKNEEEVNAVIEENVFERCCAPYTVQEYEREEVTANAYYKKHSPTHISGHLIAMARDGGSFTLVTAASTSDECILDCWLEKDRFIDLFCSQTIYVSNDNQVPLMLSTKQYEFEMSSIEEILRRNVEMAENNLTINIDNRYQQRIEYRVIEMSEEQEIIYYQFQRPDAIADNVECVRKEERYGGSEMLQSLAASDETTTKIFGLERRRQSMNTASVAIKSTNRLKPIHFSTISSSEETIEISSSINSSSQTDDRFSSQSVSRICQTTNNENVWYQCAESARTDETTNINFERTDRDSCQLDAIIVLTEKRYGGRAVLVSRFAEESETNLYETLVADDERVAGRQTAASAQITLKMINTTENQSLSTMHSSEEHASCSYSHQARIQAHHLVEHKLIIANKYHQQLNYTFSEASSVQEGIYLNFIKSQCSATISESLAEKRTGNKICLTTAAAQHNQIEQKIYLSKEKRFDDVIGVELLCFEACTTQPIVFYTSAVTHETVFVAAHLQRSYASDGVSQTRVIARRGDGTVTLKLKESTEYDEYIGMQMRAVELHDCIEIVLSECRFGGRIQLEAGYAQQNDVSIQINLHKQKPIPTAPPSMDGDALITRKMIARGHSMQLNLMASEESNIESSWQLECNKIRHYHISALRNAPNRESTIEMKTNESLETNMTMNISLQSQQQLLQQQQHQSYTVADKRYGGLTALECLASTENRLSDVLLCLQKSQSFAQSSLKIQQANRFTPIALKTMASHESTINIQVFIDAASPSDEGYKGGDSHRRDTHQQKRSASTVVYCAIAVDGGRFAAKFTATSETIFNATISYEKQHQNDVRCTIERHELSAEQQLQLQQQQQISGFVEESESEKRVHRDDDKATVQIEHIHQSAKQITNISLQTDSAHETVIRTDERLQSDAAQQSAEIELQQAVTIVESDQIVYTTPVQVELRHHDESRDELKEEKSEKRVSFAAEVTEKTLSMDMSMTVERPQPPSIVKKPMKRESRSRRAVIKQNEAPNFVPMRRNSLLMALAMGSPHNIPHFRTLDDVIKGIKRAGLEYSNLIFGIDYTRSNYYQGEKTFDGKNLHDLNGEEMNPYQQVIEIVGRTLSSFDADGVIPTYGFGDEETTDQAIFNLYDRDDFNVECNGFEEVLRVYNEKTPFINMSGPTNFVPLIEKAIQIVREKQSYHILVIVADGQVTNEKINQKAIAAASHYPLSIIMVGVGDGPWSMMTRFDETLPKRIFDNFHFVDFHKVMYNTPNQEASFALNALMEIPDQYKAIKELGLLKHNRRG